MHYHSFQAVKNKTHDKTVFVFTSVSEKIKSHVITIVHFRPECGDSEEQMQNYGRFKDTKLNLSEVTHWFEGPNILIYNWHLR